MGIFATDKVTFYSGTLNDDGVIAYTATLFDGVNLVTTEGRNKSASGMETANSATVYIDVDSIPSGFEFDRENGFFVRGDTTARPISTYAFFEEMKENYADVFKITDVDLFDKVMPHYEIGGK